MPLMTFKANSEWSGEGVYADVTSRHFKIAADEPPALGGTDKAMNPVELLLGALASCLTIVAVFYANKLGYDVEDVSVDTEGDLDPAGFTGQDESVRPGFQQVRARLNIVSSEPRERIEELAKIAFSHCPVSNTLSGVEVKEEIVIKN